MRAYITRVLGVEPERCDGETHWDSDMRWSKGRILVRGWYVTMEDVGCALYVNFAETTPEAVSDKLKTILGHAFVEGVIFHAARRWWVPQKDR